MFRATAKNTRASSLWSFSTALIGFGAALIGLGTSLGLAQQVPLTNAERQAQSDLQQREAPPPAIAFEDIRRPQCTRTDVPIGTSPARVLIQDIVIDGVTVPEADTILEIGKELEGQTVDLYKAVVQLRFEICKAYEDFGYINGFTQTPNFDSDSGTLSFEVIEPKFYRLAFVENGKERDVEPLFLPLRKGDFVRLIDLQQALQNLSGRADVAAVRVEAAPLEDDLSQYVVLFELGSAFPLVFSATTHNGNSDATGRHQGRIDIRGGDLVGLNESWSFSFEQDLEGSNSDGSSENLSASVIIPIGYVTASAGGETYRYKTVIKGEAQDFIASGTQDSVYGGLSAVLHRDQESVTNLSGRLTYKDTDNFIQGFRLGTSSRSLSIVSAGLSHRRQFFDGILFGSVTASRGVELFGSLDTDVTRRDVPRPDFWKIEGDVSFARAFMVDEEALTVSIRVHGQWAPHALFSSEQLFVGGRQSVRGFRNDSLGGEVGAYAQTNLEYDLINLPDTFRPMAGKIVAFGGIDFGGIAENYANNTEEGMLAGGVLGLRLKHGPYPAERGQLLLEAAWHRGFASPNAVRADDSFLYITGGVQF